MRHKGFETLAFWGRMPEEPSERMARHVRRAEYEEGQIVRSADSECAGVLLVESGVFRMALCSDDGREATVYRLRPGDVCVLSASCMISAISSDVQLQAVTGGVLALIHTGIFSQLVVSHLYAASFMLKTSSVLCTACVRAVASLLFRHHSSGPCISTHTPIPE